MKLKLVGTGAITGAERSSCSLIDNKILIDCGNGLIKTLTQQGVETMDIEVVLITHLHADHFFDLPFLVLLRFISNVENNLKIFCPVGAEKIVKHLCDDYVSGKQGSYDLWKEKGKIEFIEFENLTNKEILKGYFVTSFLVCHGDKEQSYGFVVKNKNKSIGFSGDTSYCKSVDSIVSLSNIAVLDMCFPKSTPAHMGVNDIEKICFNNKDKIIIGTHSTTQARIEAKKRNIKNLIVPIDAQELDI